MKFQRYYTTTALAFLRKKHSRLSGKSNIWNSCILLPSSKSHDSCNALFCTHLSLSKLQESDIRSGNVTSVATYTPRTELDFGTLVRFTSDLKKLEFRCHLVIRCVTDWTQLGWAVLVSITFFQLDLLSHQSTVAPTMSLTARWR